MLDYFYTTKCAANFPFFSINKPTGDRNALYVIALTRCNPSQQESISPKLPKVLLMWAIAVVCWGKSSVKIRFESFCVRKATAQGKLKTRPYFEDFDCNSSAERYKLHDRSGNAYMNQVIVFLYYLLINNYLLLKSLNKVRVS